MGGKKEGGELVFIQAVQAFFSAAGWRIGDGGASCKIVTAWRTYRFCLTCG